MQAQFESNLGRLEADLERMRVESQAADGRLRESQATRTGAIVRIAKLLEQSPRQADKRFRGLDDRLNALITVVEKHITGRDHGRKRGR
jgi:hypothetical protein